MTDKDIEKVQIMATCKGGKHIIALSDNKILIRCIVACCKFMILKEDSLGEYPLKEIAEFFKED